MVETKKSFDEWLSGTAGDVTFRKRTSDPKEKMLGFLIQIFIFDFSTIPAKVANAASDLPQ